MAGEVRIAHSWRTDDGRRRTEIARGRRRENDEERERSKSLYFVAETEMKSTKEAYFQQKAV